MMASLAAQASSDLVRLVVAILDGDGSAPSRRRVSCRVGVAFRISSFY